MFCIIAKKKRRSKYVFVVLVIVENTSIEKIIIIFCLICKFEGNTESMEKY